MPRTRFHDRPRDDLPPLGFPPDAAALARIPDDWTVWAFADVHGTRDGLRGALVLAGLTDAAGRWTGEANVALVGLGDFVDRGADSAGVIADMRRLDGELAAAGSRLVSVRGNHEQMLADVLRGSDEWLESWAANGGHALARSYGLSGVTRPFAPFRDALLARDPGLLDWILATLPYATWRDVLLVHAGPPAGGDLETLAGSDAQMWELSPFLGSAGIALEPAYRGYRDAGVARVVVGHRPQNGAPTVDHAGALLLIDSNASSGKPNLASAVSLVELPARGSFEAARMIVVPT